MILETMGLDMSKETEEYIPYKEIPGRLNIVRGDTLLLTSDILRLAMKARKYEKAFNADQFLDAFIEALGNEGTLLIPSYNFDLENGDGYSIRETQPMTGALAVAALKRDDFWRTSNPLHSFLVTGADARLLAELNNPSSFGPGSPFAYLLDQNALMLFAGTTVSEAMTFTHYVEESLQVKYRRYKDLNISYRDADGHVEKRKFTLYSKKPGYTMKLGILEKKLKQEYLDTIIINGIPFSMIRCRQAYEAISHDIRNNRARSIAAFEPGLFVRDILKHNLKRFRLFRTTYGKIRSAKRIY